MRTEPAEVIRKTKETEEQKKVRIQTITRKVALAVAFVSVFFFVIKILFL